MQLRLLDGSMVSYSDFVYVINSYLKHRVLSLNSETKQYESQFTEYNPFLSREVITYVNKHINDLITLSEALTLFTWTATRVCVIYIRA